MDSLKRMVSKSKRDERKEKEKLDLELNQVLLYNGGPHDVETAIRDYPYPCSQLDLWKLVAEKRANGELPADRFANGPESTPDKPGLKTLVSHPGQFVKGSLTRWKSHKDKKAAEEGLEKKQEARQKKLDAAWADLNFRIAHLEPGRSTNMLEVDIETSRRSARENPDTFTQFAELDALDMEAEVLAEARASGALPMLQENKRSQADIDAEILKAYMDAHPEEVKAKNKAAADDRGKDRPGRASSQLPMMDPDHPHLRNRESYLSPPGDPFGDYVREEEAKAKKEREEAEVLAKQKDSEDPPPAY